MTTHIPTVEELVEIIGKDPDTWKGQCSYLAQVVVDNFGGTHRYGHWNGPIHPDSLFAGKSIVHHAWVELEDGTVVDPTRWVFECNEPYVFHGGTEHYDIGGNALRRLMMRPCPVAGPDNANALTPLDFTDEEITILQQASSGVISSSDLTKMQMFWVCNLPYDEFRGRASSIYQSLIDNGFKAMIPVDNYRLAFGL